MKQITLIIALTTQSLQLFSQITIVDISTFDGMFSLFKYMDSLKHYQDHLMEYREVSKYYGTSFNGASIEGSNMPEKLKDLLNYSDHVFSPSCNVDRETVITLYRCKSCIPEEEYFAVSKPVVCKPKIKVIPKETIIHNLQLKTLSLLPLSLTDTLPYRKINYFRWKNNPY